jgi:hypothetical protein
MTDPSEPRSLARGDAPNPAIGRGFRPNYLSFAGTYQFNSAPDCLNGTNNAAFNDLARRSAELRQKHPDADWISAGMSEDLESAIAHGATHLRVGSALLGRREPVLG